MTRKFSSISVETTLASSISSSATSMTIATGTATLLMGGATLTAGNVDQFTIAIDPDTVNEEIVFVTNVVSDTLTIVRGRAGSSQIAHSSGAVIKHVLTSDDLSYFNSIADLGLTPTNTVTVTNKNLSSGTNTFPSNFVTTDGTQTLTNKTINASTNTFVGVMTTSSSDTLTNKTISGASNTVTNISLTSGVTGTLPVANGGTGVTSLGTGVATFLGTPSSANLASAITDETGSGSLVFGTSPTIATATINTATVNNPVIISPEERTTVSATAATGTVNFDALTQGVLYYTSNASANWTLNIRGNSSTTLNSMLTTGDAVTVVFLNTNGTTAYYPTVYQIDGTGFTPKWQGGNTPSAGNASSIDAYSLTIIKTASTPTYTVIASQTKFA